MLSKLEWAHTLHYDDLNMRQYSCSSYDKEGISCLQVVTSQYITFSISSASSKTKILSPLSSSILLPIQLFNLPCVPKMTCWVIFWPLQQRSLSCESGSWNPSTICNCFLRTYMCRKKPFEKDWNLLPLSMLWNLLYCSEGCIYNSYPTGWRLAITQYAKQRCWYFWSLAPDTERWFEVRYMNVPWDESCLLTSEQAGWKSQRKGKEHLGTSKSETAVEIAVMLVCLDMRCRTSTFWMTNSLVGHTHNAWGVCSARLTLLSIAKTKQVVFPLPLCACNICSK